ncbi:MAG: hypothetical protein KKB65_00045 [Nanoarchaeota archaeon]|nr:hypothetical protein [Nanoarchaeota archaeon]
MKNNEKFIKIYHLTKIYQTVNTMNEQQIMAYVEDEIKKSLFSLDINLIRKEIKNENKQIDLLIETKDNKIILVEVKSSGEPSNIYKAISQLKYYQSNEDEYLMVAVPLISEKSKDICKQSGVGYIDLTGNVFVKYNNVLIDKTENKKLPEKLLPNKKRVKDLFSGNALKVLIEILKEPSKSFTQGKLSKDLRLSKGYVNRILKTFEEGIKENGETLFLETPLDWVETSSNKTSEPSVLRKTKQYKISNPSKLLDALSKKYNFKGNKIISFYSFERDTNKLMNEISMIGNKNKLDYAFTLHAGASLTAPFVRFDDVYFYAKDEDINKWAELLDLKRTEFGGNIFFVIPRYKWILDDKITIQTKKTINDIMLYLDLINYPKRGKEQADFLREKKIGY